MSLDRSSGARRSIVHLALVLGSAALALAVGCVGLPPNLSSDPCQACIQNCRLTTNMCGSSSASQMACREKAADCDYKCRKRYCPREKDPSDQRERAPEAQPAGPAQPTP